MSRISVVLISTLFCMTSFAAEALYAFGPGDGGFHRGGSTGFRNGGMHAYSAAKISTAPKISSANKISAANKISPVKKVPSGNKIASVNKIPSGNKISSAIKIPSGNKISSIQKTGMKTAGFLGGKLVLKPMAGPGKGGPKMGFAGPHPHHGPMGHAFHHKHHGHWGFFKGKWWPYWAFVGGTWWWWNQGNWITVEDGPEALYDEPVIVTQATDTEYEVE